MRSRGEQLRLLVVFVVLIAHATCKTPSMLRLRQRQTQEVPQEDPGREPGDQVDPGSEPDQEQPGGNAAKQAYEPPQEGGSNWNIIGGILSNESYPFYGRWTKGCGASLIAPDIMLTAAHCGNTTITDNTKVYIGSTEATEGVVRTVVESFPHPQYNSTTEHYDFMLIKLDSSALEDGFFDYTTRKWTTTPTNLTTIALNEDPAAPAEGEDLLVMGFGVTNQDDQNQVSDLREVMVKAFDRTCPSSYSPQTIVPEIMICAGFPEGGKDACRGMQLSRVMLLDCTF